MIDPGQNIRRAVGQHDDRARVGGQHRLDQGALVAGQVEGFAIIALPFADRGGADHHDRGVAAARPARRPRRPSRDGMRTPRLTYSQERPTALSPAPALLRAGRKRAHVLDPDRVALAGRQVRRAAVLRGTRRPPTSSLSGLASTPSSISGAPSSHRRIRQARAGRTRGARRARARTSRSSGKRHKRPVARRRDCG